MVTEKDYATMAAACSHLIYRLDILKDYLENFEEAYLEYIDDDQMIILQMALKEELRCHPNANAREDAKTVYEKLLKELKAKNRSVEW